MTCEMSLLLVLTSLRGFFSRLLGLPLQKTNTSKFQLDLDIEDLHETTYDVMWPPLYFGETLLY